MPALSAEKHGTLWAMGMELQQLLHATDRHVVARWYIAGTVADLSVRAASSVAS